MRRPQRRVVGDEGQASTAPSSVASEVAEGGGTDSGGCATLNSIERRQVLLSPSTVILARTPPGWSREDVKGLISAFGPLASEGIAFLGGKGDTRAALRMQRLADAALITQLLDGRSLREAEALATAFRLLLASNAARKEGGGSVGRPSASAILALAASKANVSAKAATAAGDTDRAAMYSDLATRLEQTQPSSARKKAGATDGKAEFVLQLQLSKEDKIRVAALKGHEKAVNLTRMHLRAMGLQTQQETSLKGGGTGVSAVAAEHHRLPASSVADGTERSRLFSALAETNNADGGVLNSSTSRKEKTVTGPSTRRATSDAHAPSHALTSGGRTFSTIDVSLSQNASSGSGGLATAKRAKVVRSSAATLRSAEETQRQNSNTSANAAGSQQPQQRHIPPRFNQQSQDLFDLISGTHIQNLAAVEEERLLQLQSASEQQNHE